MSSFEEAWDACRFDDIETLKTLVPSKVDPNTCAHSDDNHLNTLLCACSSHGARECAAYLIDSGALVKAKNHAGFNALHWAAYSGRLECVGLLLEAKIGIESKTEDGRTALHIAAERGHFAFVKAILEKKADINAVNSVGWSAVRLALVTNQRIVIDFLIENGCDYKQMDYEKKKIDATAKEFKRDWFIKKYLDA